MANQGGAQGEAAGCDVPLARCKDELNSGWSLYPF